MSEQEAGAAPHPGPRRWTFKDCEFDEASWSLLVGGHRVHVETKPLVLLRELLIAAGAIVPKERLIKAIWPNVTVVEASLTTAAHKLRAALQDDGTDRRIIETAPGMGYRLAVPVRAEQLTKPGLRRHRFVPRLGIAAGSVFALLALGSWSLPPDATPAPTFTQQQATAALRQLDIGRIEQMLAQGWNPNTPIGRQGSAPLHYVLEMCEWDPGHDQRRLMMMVRTLFEGGAKLDHRNIFGDTPYSIASAPRYCGPDHPATKAIAAPCFLGFKPLGDRCRASYQIKRAPKI